jgi:uncharacterized membrane protein
MKRICASLLVVSLTLVMAACDRSSKPGGPGATADSGKKKPIVGQAENTFQLDPPNLSTNITQGEAKNISIGIKRGDNFTEDVALKFDNLPKGLSIDPASPKIKAGDTEAKVTLKAGDDAPVGDHTVKVIGQPTKGSDASSELKVTVKKK